MSNTKTRKIVTVVKPSSQKRLRSTGISFRKSFVSALSTAGVTGEGFSKCTNAVYVGLFGSSHSKMVKDRGLTDTENLRDFLTKSELAMLNFAEELIARIVNTNEITGRRNVEKVCSMMAKAIGEISKYSTNAVNFADVMNVKTSRRK